MIGAIALHEWRRLRAGMMFWLLLAWPFDRRPAELCPAGDLAGIAPQLKAGASRSARWTW